MQLQQLSQLLIRLASSDCSIKLTDIFGNKQQIDHLLKQRLESELLEQEEQAPLTVIHIENRKEDVLGEFMVKGRPVEPREPGRDSRDYRPHSMKKQQGNFRHSKQPETQTQAQDKIEITIDLPELEDEKTPKLMIQDIQEDLGQLLRKMKNPPNQPKRKSIHPKPFNPKSHK